MFREKLLVARVKKVVLMRRRNIISATKKSTLYEITTPMTLSQEAFSSIGLQLTRKECCKKAKKAKVDRLRMNKNFILLGADH